MHRIGYYYLPLSISSKCSYSLLQKDRSYFPLLSIISTASDKLEFIYYIQSFSNSLLAAFIFAIVK
jgi:hypothetical protein